MYKQEVIDFIKERYKNVSYKQLAEMANSRFNTKLTERKITDIIRLRKFERKAIELPLYSEYINPHDNFTYIKIAENKWIYKHVWIWEKANGKIPPDHCLMFIDGNRLNYKLDNLLLVHKGIPLLLIRENMRYTDPEMLKTAVAILQHRSEIIKRIKNIREVGESDYTSKMKIKKTPLEISQSMSEARKGKRLTEETRRKISEALKGKPKKRRQEHG